MSDSHALSGAYAVDALDDLEKARFERHLADCEICRAEVDGLREAAAALAADAEAAPPAALRDRVLAGIQTVRPLPPVREPSATDAGPVTPGAPATPTRSPRRWLPALVAAAVVTVLGLGAVAWHPWVDETPRLTAADRVLQAPDARAVRLDFPDGSSATVTRSERERLAVITTNRMAPPPAGRVYELWFQHADGSMSPAGLMPVKADQTVVLDGDAAAAVGAGITVEPAGGSAEPTGDPIALFDFGAAT